MLPRLWVAIFALAGLAFVGLLAAAVTTGVTDAADRTIIEAIRDESLADVLAPLRVITELGSTVAVTIVAGLTVVVGVLIGPWLHGVAGAISIGIASLGVDLVKTVVARARPTELDPIVVERGFSFPSGHATLSMAAYGILAILIVRARLPYRVQAGGVIVLGLVILAVGMSRAWLGVHYPTDVLAGWTTGAVFVLLFASLTRGVSREPAAAAADGDPATPRSDRPVPG